MQQIDEHALLAHTPSCLPVGEWVIGDPGELVDPAVYERLVRAHDASPLFGDGWVRLDWVPVAGWWVIGAISPPGQYSVWVDVVDTSVRAGTESGLVVIIASTHPCVKMVGEPFVRLRVEPSTIAAL